MEREKDGARGRWRESGEEVRRKCVKQNNVYLKMLTVQFLVDG